MPKTKTKTRKVAPTKKVKKKVAAAPAIINGNGANSRSQLSSLIKSARDIMRKDAGLNGDLDRLPQLSWILFLKCFDDLEQRREAEAEMTGETYKTVIPKNFRWRDWAADADRGRTGPELLEFVNNQLLPKLRDLSGTEERQGLAAVFGETYSRMLSGYLLRDVVNLINGLNFNSSDDIFTLGHLYESMLKEMRDAAGDSGEFYTPRPVVRLIVNRVTPKIGERVLDPACGTGGFLVETYEYLKQQQQTAADRKTLQTRTLFGVEKKPLPFLLGTMNLLLHGIETPHVIRDNALRKPLNEIGEKDRYDVIVTNPPFGGEEEAGIQLNFPEATRASETALLFMQFIMRSLKVGGRCGVVVPNGTLFGDGVSARIKEQLLKNFNLHTIVRLPNGVFAPYTSIPTNLLFFDRPSTSTSTSSVSAQDAATVDIWFYEHVLPEGVKNYTKTRPMTFEEFAPLLAWWDARQESERAWKVRAADLIQYDADGNLLSVNLDVKNPSRAADLEHLPPAELAESIAVKEKQILGLMDEIKRLLQQ